MLCLPIISTQYMVAIIIFSTGQSLGDFHIYYLSVSSPQSSYYYFQFVDEENKIHVQL